MESVSVKPVNLWTSETQPQSSTDFHHLCLCYKNKDCVKSSSQLFLCLLLTALMYLFCPVDLEHMLLTPMIMYQTATSDWLQETVCQCGVVLLQEQLKRDTVCSALFVFKV